jgi:predicted nuclease with RNAse H fold
MGTAPVRVASMGIDVSVTRGLDIVVLDDSLRVASGPTTLHLADLADLIRRTETHVIAIDSPPAWGLSGKSRPIERQLQALGISIFPAPAAEFARELHRWMETGFDVFKVAGDLGYPLYTGGASSARSAIEVFPHASAVVLRGSLAPVGVAKSVWRRAVLEAAGIDCSDMRTDDHLDAALAALTGLKFLTWDFSVVGTPGEAVLVLPIGGMPTTRYARDKGAASSRRLGLHAARRPLVDETGYACGCGCGAPARRRYLPGHDAKHKSRLLAEMRAGSASAADELQRLGWGRISAGADNLRRLGPHAARRPLVDDTGHACGCGCGAAARRRYLPGHDAKHKSRLLAETRAGSVSAADELQRLGWGRISAVADNLFP